MDEFKVLAGKEAEGALPFKKQSPGAWTLVPLRDTWKKFYTAGPTKLACLNPYILNHLRKERKTNIFNWTYSYVAGLMHIVGFQSSNGISIIISII